MKSNFWRSGIALALAVTACAIYVFAVVPWIEPQVRRRSASSDSTSDPREPSGGGSFALQQANLNFLSDLFPSGSWELDDPKVVKTDRALFFFQKWEPQPERRLEVTPCTVVLLPAESADNNPTSSSAYLVMSAPGGAILQFDEDSDPSRAQFGTLIGGRLPGEIQIRRQETTPGAGDGIEIVTSNIQIDQQQIWTPHDVNFRYGTTHGSGRDLSITLQPKSGPDPNNLFGSVLGGVRFIELVHVERVHIEMPKAPAKRGEASARDAVANGALPGALPGTNELATPVGNKPSARQLKRPDGLFGAAQDAPLDVTCRGPFRVDLIEQLASFEDQVVIERPSPTAAGDQLQCEVLRVHFRRRNKLVGTLDEQAAAAKDAGDRTSWFEVERLVATGNPVMLKAPSFGAAAQGQRLEFNTKTRLLHLESTHGASLDFGLQHLEAPNIQYEMNEDQRRLGRAWASGPGRMRRRGAKQGDASLSASWGKELLLRPQQDKHVLSLTGGTAINWEGTGTFNADELHVWLLETPSDTEQSSLGADRMLAQGSVQFDSPRMIGRAQRLEAWFTHEPADLNAPQGEGVTMRPVGRTVPGDANENGPAGVANNGVGGEQPNEPPGARFDVHGDLVRIQVAQAGSKTRLDEISIRGGVEVTEVEAVRGAGDPLKITGDILKIEDAETVNSRLHITGRPARISARGTSIVSSEVWMNQAENRVWIEDGGEMTLPAFEPRPKPRGQILYENPRAAVGLPASAPPRERFDPGAVQRTTSKAAPIIITWKGRLDFDGQNAHFQKDVQVRGANRMSSGEQFELLIMGGVLDVNLNQRISFTNAKPSEELELQRLTFDGNVYFDGRTTLAGGITSFERMQLRNLSLEHPSGRLHGLGPGWLSSTRLDMGSSKDASPIPGGAPAAAPTPRLLFVHVDFSRELNGNLQTRAIEFLDQVNAVFGPVLRWEDELDPQHPEAIGETGATLVCQRLALAQSPGALPGGGDGLEFEATGNTVVEGQKFLARSARVSYSQAKDLLILAGDNVSDVEFWKKPRRSASSKADAIARSILYWRRDGRIEIPGAKYIDLNPVADEVQRQRGGGAVPPR